MILQVLKCLCSHCDVLLFPLISESTKGTHEEWDVEILDKLHTLRVTCPMQQDRS